MGEVVDIRGSTHDSAVETRRTIRTLCFGITNDELIDELRRRGVVVAAVDPAYVLVNGAVREGRDDLGATNVVWPKDFIAKASVWLDDAATVMEQDMQLAACAFMASDPYTTTIVPDDWEAIILPNDWEPQNTGR